MTMREKMARAGFNRMAASCEDAGMPVEPWDHETPGLREDWLKVADAVLDALMEPTPAMLEAAQNRSLDQDDCHYQGVWRAMIAAAKEG